MFRYTIIDVGDELITLNKEDGGLAPADRRDSWPPRFPTGYFCFWFWFVIEIPSLYYYYIRGGDKV